MGDHDGPKYAIVGSNRGDLGGSLDEGTFWIGAAGRDADGPSLTANPNGIRIASIVPEPSTALLMGLGLVGLAVRGRGKSTEAYKGYDATERVSYRCPQETLRWVYKSVNGVEGPA